MSIPALCSRFPDEATITSHPLSSLNFPFSSSRQKCASSLYLTRVPRAWLTNKYRSLVYVDGCTCWFPPRRVSALPRLLCVPSTRGSWTPGDPSCPFRHVVRPAGRLGFTGDSALDFVFVVVLYEPEARLLVSWYVYGSSGSASLNYFYASVSLERAEFDYVSVRIFWLFFLV